MIHVRSVIFFFLLFSHTWYQSESAVVVVIPIRNVQRDQVQVESTDTNVYECFNRFRFIFSVFI